MTNPAKWANPDWSEHYTKWAAGVVTAHVVRDKLEAATIAKVLATVVERGRLSAMDLKRALDTVDSLSVRDFETRNPERRRRLEQIRNELAGIQQS
jgi:hypothetical protein